MELRERGNCKITLPGDLLEAVFVSRLNRFVAEVEIRGRRELAHVPSSGRMGELLYSGARVFVSGRVNPGARLRYRILLAGQGNCLVSVDSLLPNRLVDRALKGGALPELSGYDVIRREQAFGNGRFDFYLKGGAAGRCFVEVKSVTLVEDGVALFPDAPSERGARHMAELAGACGQGFRAVVLFIIQRNDAVAFRPNSIRDPRFSRELARAAGAGVEVLARRCRVSMNEVMLDETVKVCL